jgi:hypothetical protein
MADYWPELECSISPQKTHASSLVRTAPSPPRGVAQWARVAEFDDAD